MKYFYSCRQDSTLNSKSQNHKIAKSRNHNMDYDMNTISANVPSLCIPRVFANITRDRIKTVIQELNIGEIDRIDLIVKTGVTGEKFQRVFIHLKSWSQSENAIIARQRLLQGKEVKIIYDEPWFWKVSANRSTPSYHKNVGDEEQTDSKLQNQKMYQQRARKNHIQTVSSSSEEIKK